MTAAALHELTALREYLTGLRDRKLAEHNELDDMCRLVSRMEDDALNREGLFSPPFLSEAQELESRGRDEYDRGRA